MARRFGGKYSPQGSDTDSARDQALHQAVSEARRIDAAGAKANALFLPAVVMAVMAIWRPPAALLAGLIGAGILALAAWLTRDGLRAEAAYNARRVARRPALPRKMLGTALTGIGIAIAGWTTGTGITGAVIYGIAGAGLHFAAFGPDPLRDKRMDGIDTFQQDRVARVVDEAESYLAAMSDHVGRLEDRDLNARVATFQAVARRMIRTVEEDPRDLTGARKFLSVYLMGARDASVKFAELHARTRDAGARADYEALLTDLEENFAARTERMLLDDRSDMDVEIKVLRDRLQREGV
ncbi:MAG: 5-bromo-4-chloroindolyl phosphate hydrolysis protein [Rhodobacteraceae bacterium HLUCCA08]|nr:MAG: 5-bromo-4-chloroindolyl phosphate hydrolysis protein [Rhodobacteraceae bacterium HLUCCA08]